MANALGEGVRLGMWLEVEPAGLISDRGRRHRSFQVASKMWKAVGRFYMATQMGCFRTGMAH